MSYLDNLLDTIKKSASQVAASGSSTAAKMLGAVNAPRVGPEGSSLFASLANWGGSNDNYNKDYQPFTWVKPAYASDLTTSGGGGGAGGDDFARDPNRSYTDQPNFMNPSPSSSTPSGQPGGNSNYSFNANDFENYKGWDPGSAYQDWLAKGSPLPGDVASQMQTAQAAKQSELEGILSRLSLMRDVASQKISRAGEVKSNMLGSIGEQYGALRQSAQNKRDTSLENLGQEDLNVQNQYGRATGNARRALDSALTRNRMLARAMNRLNSSFYDDRQAETNEFGARTVADIGTEEASKRAGIGTRMTETKNWFEEQSLNLDNEEKDLRLKAEAEYNDKIDEASYMEKAYGIDALGEARQAELTYQSKLDQIDQYIQNKALRLAEISATAGDRAGVINSFSAINPQLQTLLANTKALSSAQNIGDQLPSFSNTGNTSNNYLAFMRQQPVSEQEERLRQLFGYTS